MNHDDGLDAARDALNSAVDDLLAGAPADTVIERLPHALRPLLDAGSRLARHRRSSDAPRPGFVVGLGDQLRMDLRLSFAQPSDPPVDAQTVAPAAAPGEEGASIFRPKAWWPIVLAGVVFGFLAGIVVRAGDAQPGDPLYPVKRGMERVQLQSEPSEIGRVESRLDQAWRRLGELRQVVEEGQWSDDSVLVLVDGLLTAYDDVLIMAGSVENDSRALRRAHADADAAAVELDRLALGLAPPVATALVRASRRLRLRVAAVPIANLSPTPETELPRIMPGGAQSVPGAPPPTEPAGQAPPSPAPSLPPEPPTSEPTGTPIPTPTSTIATPLPPTATPTLDSTRTVPPAEPPPGGATPVAPATITPSGPGSAETLIAPTASRPADPIEATPTVVRPDPSIATATQLATTMATATATRLPPLTPSPAPSATPTRGQPNPPQPPTISPPTSTPVGEPLTPKPPPTDQGNATASPTPEPLPSATTIDPGDRPGGGRRREP